MMKKYLILLCMLVLAGCSNRAIYENLQINKRNECLRQPASVYEDCMGAMSKSYEEYERARRGGSQE